MLHYTHTNDMVTGMIKTFIFGAIVAVVACDKGLNCPQGAEGVGRATTEAVVYSSITILISNFLSDVVAPADTVLIMIEVRDLKKSFGPLSGLAGGDLLR